MANLKGIGSVDFVGHHYKTALKLRGQNFPLAALNLAAWQANELNQLAEAEETLIENCSKRMAPNKTKNHNQHVRAQIECLISGCRLVLGDFGARARATVSAVAPLASGEKEDQRGSANSVNSARREQTTATTTTAGSFRNSHEQSERASIASADEKCSKVSGWLELARAKVEQIDGGRSSRLMMMTPADSDASARRPSLGAAAGLDAVGDLHRQLAMIHWLEWRCDRTTREASSQWGRRFALASASPIEWDIYLDFADKLEGAAWMSSLEEAALVEARKRGRRVSIAATLIEFARRLAARRSLERALALARRAIALEPNNHVWSTLAGQLSYDLRHSAESETHYKRALEELRANANLARVDSSCGALIGESSLRLRRQLAAAHANYGAILQVNGRPNDLVHAHYRLALDCDPNNLVARQNLKRIAANTRRTEMGPPFRDKARAAA